jgi:NADH:ubiquinone oxidoreductase subunit F (NADH-binding)/NAD-dependent dihydropyrimidine dehydrogenase PreA subunit
LDFKALQEKSKKEYQDRLNSAVPVIYVGAATCGMAAGSGELLKMLPTELENLKIKAQVIPVGCIGPCCLEPLVDIQKPGKPRLSFQQVNPRKLHTILEDYLLKDNPHPEFALGIVGEGPASRGIDGIPLFTDHQMLKGQMRIALRNAGMMDPTRIEDYIARGGYTALEKAFQMKPEEIIDWIKKSGLRGRGGGGFATGKKWDSVRNAEGEVRYILCNGDEGDPGAFMDRSLMESDPHSIIEGQIIAAYAIAWNKSRAEGYIYVRNEYPLAVKNLVLALEQARKLGFLGKNIMGSHFDFDIKINRGGGAFVCGESSALMRSLEGKAGEPRQKYIHASDKGLWDQPTNLNNVETYACVPEVINKGWEWFSKIGTKGSKGTKVFSLVGKITNSGLVEVPMGISLKDMVHKIGGGIKGGKKFKAVQTGGPSGGVIPESLIDLQVDFDELTRVGSMMGSGAMIVMDEGDCMVDVALYYVKFLEEESCGKCVPCREGLRRMKQILVRITEGKGVMEDVATLEELGQAMQIGSICGLGQSAPNPVLSTIKYFRKEYEQHIQEKRCYAGVCTSLISFLIDPVKCTGCHLCEVQCPTGAAKGEKKKPHSINMDLCIKCGICYDVCKDDAVLKK